MTGDYFTAEDIAQETFLSAYTHMDRFDGTNEKAWLARIAANKCTDYLRSTANRAVPTAEEEMPEPTPEPGMNNSSISSNPSDIYEAEDVINCFTRYCDNLPEGYGDIAKEHFIDGRTAKEIAEEKGSNLKTVQTKIYRAREMLKKNCGKEWLEA